MIQLLHKWCLQDTGVITLFVISHLVIFISYMVIPILAIRFLKQQRIDAGKYLAFWLTAGFIFSCGLTHAAAIWTTVVRPDYALEGGLLAITAMISATTAAMLSPALKYLAGFKDLDTYRRTNHDLRDQMQLLLFEKEKQSEELIKLRESVEHSELIGSQERKQILDRLGYTFHSLDDAINRINVILGNIPNE